MSETNEKENEHRGSGSKLSGLVIRQNELREQMHAEGLRPGMLGYCYIADDGNMYVWREVTPLWKRIINWVEIFGGFHEYKPERMDAV